MKSVVDYEGDTPIEVINNITSSYKKEENLVKKSVSQHVKESIKNRNQQFFKQKKPTINKKIKKNINPKLEITDIVNRDILRSNSVTSIPLNDIEMFSRSASLDSIATAKHNVEMISRPSSIESIHNFNKESSFRQPIKLIKPKTTVDVKPKQPLIKTVNSIKTNDEPLTAAAKVVLKNKNEAKTAKAVKTITPPTTSLTKSTEEQIVKKRAAAARAAIKTKQQEQIIKKKTAAAKADEKTKQQEQVVK